MSALSTLPLSIIKYIRSMWMAEMLMTYLHVDKNGLLMNWGGHPRYYGLTDLATGVPVNEQIVFLEGLLPVEHAQVIEFICMENGRCAHVHLVPSDNGTWVLLLDATIDHGRQQKLQQQLNELSILTYRQSQVVQKLEAAREALADDKEQLEKISNLKSRFIAGLSHELRTPLSSIVGYTQLLDEATQNDEKEARYLTNVKNSANHLLSLIDTLLEQTRIENGKVNLRPTQTDLNDLCDNLKGLFFPAAQEKQLEFQITLNSSFPRMVTVDEVRLRQILINLINNALKFTEQGHVHLEVEWQDNKFYFTVSDTGRGIPREQLDKIFTAFHQVDVDSPVGAGLGLSISYSLVQRMQGELNVESTVGQGSIFRGFIQAPLAYDMKPEHHHNTDGSDVEHTSSQTHQPAHEMTVLLAEDSIYLSTLMEVYLEDAGYSVVKASNGLEVLNLLDKHNPEVLIMDMHMPALDGYKTTQQLREQGFDKPIIAISASTLPKDHDYALEIGCQTYLTKPIQSDTLLAAIDNVLSTTH
ncbi:ATP-binding protein [Candidatus Albibeggiatoa sp. nov. NOAA]|uniref:hybrid sensor histidine kinase/response regulator n=1 Tax=Candidatus Albibeggiatoa sp. nov. NOAA TaxID=3162724 RepID=UPI00330266B0|nr:ATP-binding protein [Thiotrichaceae bacterium]